MANQFLKLRRSAVPGRIPSTSSLDFGEIALNTYDGLAFIKKSGSAGEEIIAIGANTTAITGSTNFIPLFSGPSSLVTSSIYQTGFFTGIRATDPSDINNPDVLFINGINVPTYNIVSAHGELDNYIQLNIQNFSSGTFASSDIVATADNGTENSGYINMGINSSGYSVAGAVGGAGDSYVYSVANDMYIGNTIPGHQVVLFNGGPNAYANARIWIFDQGTVGINTDEYNQINPPSLQIEAPNSSTYNLVQAKGSVDNFLQVGIANENPGTYASADLALYNNIDPINQSAGFVDIGINSTNYDNPLYPGKGGDAYVFTDSNHLILGATSGSENTKVTIFAGGSSESENAKLILFSNNQHEMTGSLNISGSLTVGGTIIAQTLVVQTITSSIDFVTGSTRFGSLLSNTHQFTGSVSITGSFNAPIITGSLFGTASWAQNAVTASSADNFTIRQSLIAPSITASLGFAGDGSALTNVGYIEKVYYVAEDGSDANDGKTLSTPFRTIKAAITAASASRSSNPETPAYRQSIHVKTGYYVEEAPIIVPSNTAILGDDLRTVVIRPTTETSGSNLFLMNNGTYCWGLRLEGCAVDNLEDPRNGFFFAFAPNAFIITSPYIQNCSAIHTPADKFYTPLDSGSNPPNSLVGNGPGGMIVDDSVLNGYSPLRSMIVDAYTQVAFNGIGICVRGRGYAQLVSFFTNFSRVGVYCIEGGQASLLNSNTTFGDYGLRSKGVRMLVKPNISGVSSSIDVSGSLIIKSEKNSIRNYMINKLQISGSYNQSYTPTGSRYQSTLIDSGLLIDSLCDDLLVPGAARTSQFGSGLFKGQDISSGSIYTLPIAAGSNFTEGAITVFPLISNSSGSLAGDFIKSYQYIKEYIINDPDSKFTSVTAAGKGKVGQLLDVVIDVVQRVVVDQAGADLLQEFGSLITSTSHDFSYAGAGVNFLALPINQGGVGETKADLRVVEENGGRVYHTSGDETGDFYAGNGFIIRQATGTIEGRTFYKSVTAQITPINLALETN